MRQPGVKVRDLVDDVQDSVDKLAQSVGHDQRPAVRSEARGNLCFVAPTAPSAPVSAPAPSAAVASVSSQRLREERFWNEAKAVGTSDGHQACLDRYPDGEYAGLAKASIRRLTAVSAANPPPALPKGANAPVVAPTSGEKAPSGVATAVTATPPQAATGNAAPSNSTTKLASAAAPAACAAQEARTRSYAIGGSFPNQVSEGFPARWSSSIPEIPPGRKRSPY